MRRYLDHRHRSPATEFKPGVSGNPKGRPLGTGWRQRAERLLTAWGDRSPEAVKNAYFYTSLLVGQRNRKNR
jgi:hypothetical protein